MPEPPRSGLVPNFDREAEGRLRAANAAYRQYAQTYRQGPVASGLRKTGYAGQYRGSDAAFIKAAVKMGPDGYANARAFLHAARNDPDAVAAMHDAVLNPLRRIVTGNGTLGRAALESWKSGRGYGPALRAFDEVTPGFSSRFDTAADATQALLDLGIEPKAALEAHQAEAARQAVLDNVRRREALGQANAADRATVDRLLADRRSTDRAADARSKAETDAGVATARGMLAEAKASPAARFAGKVGGAGAALAYLGNTLRQAGIRRTADLYREVMANPELARAFISKMPATPDGAPLQVLARVLRRGLILGPMLAGQSSAFGPDSSTPGARPRAAAGATSAVSGHAANNPPQRVSGRPGLLDRFLATGKAM